MKHLYTFNLFESIADKAEGLTDDYYLLIDDRGKTTVIMLVKDGKLQSFISIKHLGDDAEVHGSTAIESGTGIYVYEAAMMHTYPGYICSDTNGQISSDAYMIWLKYNDRSDVEKRKMDPDEYKDLGDFKSDEPEAFWYRKKPESWYNELVGRGKMHQGEIPGLIQDAQAAWGRY